MEQQSVLALRDGASVQDAAASGRAGSLLENVEDAWGLEISSPDSSSNERLKPRK